MEKTVHITIKLPDGYSGAKYDEETHVVNFIRDEKYPVLSFEDALKDLNGETVYFIDSQGDIRESDFDFDFANLEEYGNTIYSYEEAEAFKALMNLRLIWHVCIRDWNPSDDQQVYYISRYDLSVNIGTRKFCKEPFIFPTEASAAKFIIMHKDLLYKIKTLWTI